MGCAIAERGGARVDEGIGERMRRTGSGLAGLQEPSRLARESALRIRLGGMAGGDKGWFTSRASPTGGWDSGEGMRLRGVLSYYISNITYNILYI